MGWPERAWRLSCAVGRSRGVGSELGVVVESVWESGVEGRVGEKPGSSSSVATRRKNFARQR